MPMVITCACGKVLQVDDQHRGNVALCPACRHTVGIDDSALEVVTAIQAESPVPRAIDPPLRSVKSTSQGVPWFLFAGIGGFLALFGCLACGGIGALMYPRFDPELPMRKDAARKHVAGAMTTACRSYRTLHGHYPDRLEELIHPDEFGVVYLQGSIRDPWGAPYRYDPAGIRNHGSAPDIWAIAPDGTILGNWREGPDVKHD